jgi:hypothetical protein
MSKSKLEMVEDMRITITAMSELFDWAGISGALEIPIESENLKADFIRLGYKWLYKTINPLYQHALEIWKLLPRDLWIRYKAWGEFEEHRESRLLNERLLKLRKAVRSKSRPDFFKRGKINAAIKKLHKKGTRKIIKNNA